MPVYHFAPEAGTVLGAGSPSAPAIAAELDRLGLPHAGVQIARRGDSALLEGEMPDNVTRERLVLAIGNLHGIAVVEDRLRTVAPAPGLLESLGGFAHLPPGAAGTEAAETAVHRAQIEAGESFGPAGSLLHMVQPGETWAEIAQRHYGSPAEAARLIEANAPVAASADTLPPGLVLRIPPR